ncbi:hypothetical protein EON77_20535 [bacterium]|nr:MAG: hypothetical protein EON77_20535 [bacterium]
MPHSISKQLISHAAGTPEEDVVGARSAFGLFYAAFADGRLVVVDAEKARVVRAVVTSLSDVVDLEVGDENNVYLTSRGSADLYEVDLETGALRRKLIFPAAGGTRTRSRGASLLRVGDRLFVGVERTLDGESVGGAVLVVDIAAFSIEEVIELDGLREDRESGIVEKASGPRVLDLRAVSLEWSRSSAA